MKKNLYGHVHNKNGDPLSGAVVNLKNDKFEIIQETYTDSQGNYTMLVEQKKYPFLFIAKDYPETYLEFWGSDIVISDDTKIDATVDTLELYGLNHFKIKGGSDISTLSVYFRPMSLDKYKKNEDDICPDINKEGISVWINNQSCEILVVNEVAEYASGNNMKGYLIEVSIPIQLNAEDSNVLKVQIIDKYTSALGESIRYF